MSPRSTTHDHLQRAADTAQPERAAVLARAEAAARTGREWLAVAEAWLDSERRGEAERCLVAAEPLLDHLWDHRGVARAWHRLGAADRAIATLAAQEARYTTAAETSGTSWRLLAEGFAELQDTAAVHRCLASGRSWAMQTDDFCSVARGYFELLGDGATARLLMEQAETMAVAALGRNGAPDTLANWSVAGAWVDVFGDEARGFAQLTAGLARASDVDGCLTMAAAWASLGSERADHRPRLHECLAKARSLASTFDDWFAIAEAIRQHDRDVEAMRSALQQAQQVATQAQARKAARALRDWCADAHAVDTLGPWGLLPDQLASRGPSPLGWPRDAGALFDWLRARVPDTQLETIADADGGNDRDEHLAVLREIHGTGRVPIPLPWEPREVLSLSQWDEGDRVDHTARAFCCTVLCLAELGPEPLGNGVDDTLAILLESCWVLGPEALRRLPGLLVPFADVPAGGEPLPALATLALLLVTARLDAGDARLEVLASHLLALEAPLQQSGYAHPEHGFVVGASHFDQRVQLWPPLIREALATRSARASMPALADVARRLGGDRS